MEIQRMGTFRARWQFHLSLFFTSVDSFTYVLPAVHYKRRENKDTYVWICIYRHHRNGDNFWEQNSCIKLHIRNEKFHVRKTENDTEKNKNTYTLISVMVVIISLFIDYTKQSKEFFFTLTSNSCKIEFDYNGTGWSTIDSWIHCHHLTNAEGYYRNSFSRKLENKNPNFFSTSFNWKPHARFRILIVTFLHDDAAHPIADHKMKFLLASLSLLC